MKKLIVRLLRYSGLPFIFKTFVQKNKVSILMFHDIDPESARRYFSYLKNNYNIITLNEFIESVETKSGILKNALIISFDDGHIGNYKLLGILKELDIKINIFLCSGLVNTKRKFWFSVKHHSYSKDELKLMDSVTRLKALKEVGYSLVREYPDAQALNMRQINDLKEYVEFGSHTVFHPCLDTCTDQESYSEMKISKIQLQNILNNKIESFAYPNGNYTSREISYLKELKYKMALTTEYGFNDNQTNPFTLKRLSINDTSDFNEFILRSSGAWGFLKKINTFCQF